MNTGFIRVPFYVERNGEKTHFLPGCRMPSGYRIGPKGSEQTIADYWTALKLLTEMDIPRFRRANMNGNFGIVACAPEDIEEVSRAAIEQQIANLSNLSNLSNLKNTNE